MVNEGRLRRLLDRIAEETAALRTSAVQHDDATLLSHPASPASRGGWPGSGNVPLHAYQDVDDQRVITVLRSRLDDLDAFRREIAERLAGAS